MLTILPELKAFAAKHPRWRWVLAALAAVAAGVVMLTASCTVVSSVEPDGRGGWNVELTTHVSGSRTVLPNGPAPTTQPSTERPTP